MRLKFNLLSLRDFMIALGLTIMGTGLYLYKPWVSLTVIGVLLIMFGLLKHENQER